MKKTMKNSWAKKLGAWVGCGVLLLSLAACTEGTSSTSSGDSGKTSSAPTAQATPQATPGSASSGTSLKQQTGPGPQVTKMKVFVQENSNAEEGYEPTFRLMENGNFEFSVFLYDGTALVTGTYVEGDGAYSLTCAESSMPGVSAQQLGEITLTITDTGVTYGGTTAGVTFDGASFALMTE